MRCNGRARDDLFISMFVTRIAVSGNLSGMRVVLVENDGRN